MMRNLGWRDGIGPNEISSIEAEPSQGREGSVWYREKMQKQLQPVYKGIKYMEHGAD